MSPRLVFINRVEGPNEESCAIVDSPRRADPLLLLCPGWDSARWISALQPFLLIFQASVDRRAEVLVANTCGEHSKFTGRGTKLRFSSLSLLAGGSPSRIAQHINLDDSVLHRDKGVSLKALYGQPTFLSPRLTSNSNRKHLRYQCAKDCADERQAAARQKNDEQFVRVHGAEAGTEVGQPRPWQRVASSRANPAT